MNALLCVFYYLLQFTKQFDLLSGIKKAYVLRATFLRFSI